jgi:hypothetical protein
VSEPTGLERVSIERVMAEEKNIVLLEALKVRIKQHEAGFALAKTRIDACYELASRVPSEAAVLRSVIQTWERIRIYHSRILEESKLLAAQIRHDTPDPPS